METETIDKLFLELSQITQAKTKRELAWEEAGIEALIELQRVSPSFAAPKIRALIGNAANAPSPIKDGWQTFKCGKCGTPNDVPAYRLPE